MNYYLSLQLEDIQNEIKPKEMKLEHTSTTLSDLKRHYDDLVITSKEKGYIIEQLTNKLNHFQKNVSIYI